MRHDMRNKPYHHVLRVKAKLLSAEDEVKLSTWEEHLPLKLIKISIGELHTEFINLMATWEVTPNLYSGTIGRAILS